MCHAVALGLACNIILKLQLAAELHSNLNTLHWSEQHKAYLDVGLHAAGGAVTTEVIIRCQAADGRTVVRQTTLAVALAVIVCCTIHHM